MYLIQMFTRRIVQNKNFSSECCSELFSGRRAHEFFIGHLRSVSHSTEGEIPNGKSVGDVERKLLKVAILGRPNAGKSTLINQILQTNVCAVSAKSHTTQIPVKAAFVSGNTQIIFVDTPGLVTNKEYSRFKLQKSFSNWQKSIFPNVDIIGIIQEAHLVTRSLKFHRLVFQVLRELQKPVFLILNKIDLVQNKANLLCVVNSLTAADANDSTDRKCLMKFSKVFFTCALKGRGISEMVNYLLENAKKDEWIIPEGKVCDVPIEVLIKDLLRAKFLEILPQEIPYICCYEIELLEENDLGQLICVALVTCKKSSQKIIIAHKRRKYLRTICQEIESDLYSVFRKVVKLRVVVETANYETIKQHQNFFSKAEDTEFLTVVKKV